jgi:hypothetical protein
LKAAGQVGALTSGRVDTSGNPDCLGNPELAGCKDEN